jgi:chemotaxis protein histidine kinase CheA
MSASIQNNNSASPAAAAEKVKKITLSAQSTKYMVFGNWFIDRLVAGGQMTPDSVTEPRKILGMWSSVEDQIALYDGFVADLKTNTKELKTLIRQFHKPPKAAKKAKTAASEGEKKRGRKKKEVTEEQDPILALNERIVAAAQSEEPIVEIPVYVRAPKVPDSQIKTPERPTQEELAMPAKPERPAKKKAAAAKTEEKVAAPVVEEDKELAKAEAKAAKEAAKLAEKAAKEAEKEAAKAAKEAEKEAAKAAKEAEKEAAKAAKAAAKPAKEPKKKVEAVAAVLPMPVLVRNSPPRAADDEEEEELECEVFKCDGLEYLIDSSNQVYDRNTQEMIGTYDSVSKKINKN